VPDIATGIGSAISLIGSDEQSSAAGQAAGVQTGASAAQIAELQRQFAAYQKAVAPYTQTGTDALSQQRVLLGLGSGGLTGGAAGAGGLASGPKAAPTTWQAGQSGDPLWEQILGEFNTAHTQQYGTPINRAWGADADSQAIYDRLAAEYQKRSQAQATAATAATAETPSQTPEQEQAAAMAQFESSPYFQAITRQSEDAILQNASATGGLRGGNIQDALSKNRPILLQNLIDKQLANLGGLSSQGLGAATNLGNAGLANANNIGSAMQQGAAAQAGGILGQSNANISALGNIGGQFANKFAGSGSLFAPAVTDGGYSIGQGSAYGGTRAGL